jgi:hypothetical protein
VWVNEAELVELADQHAERLHDEAVAVLAERRRDREPVTPRGRKEGGS